MHECQRLLEAIWPRGISTSFELPSQFGRFSIVRELGRGGFGIVFLAEDLLLRRRIALEMPRPEVLVTPEVRRRFLREAEAASRLDHPFIVPVYEIGEEGPICYIASAYCEGPTLAQWLRRQSAAVPIRVASRLVAVLAAAVAHAHERGILHRDLKPGNILLQQPDKALLAAQPARDDLEFVPRICDFGLAKLLNQVSQETRTGVPIGSPEYMAPEQAAGRLREHGPATDVYALGVILYELLTGRPPHRGENDLETLRLVADLDPPSPRDLRPGLPRDLETITLKCLEKRPVRRYTSAADLTADLQRFMAGRPVQARPVPPWEHASKWARRRPVHAALLVVVGALAVAVLGGLEWARARETFHSDALRVALESSRKSEVEARDQRVKADRQSLLAHQHLAANQLRLAGWLVERQDYDPALSILESLRPPQGLPETRGFAWYYLYRSISHGVPMLPALPARVRTVAHATDGRTIALADEDNNTFLLDRNTGTLRELPGKPKLTACERLVFSPDGRSLVSLSHGGSGQVWAWSEVKIWDAFSGAPVEGMAEDFGFCYQILFSPDGTLVTIEYARGNPAAQVRSWRRSDDGKRVSLGESLRADQLRDRLALDRRGGDSGRQTFRFSDCLAVTPDGDWTVAVSLESGEIELYGAGGDCKAVCRIAGPEVVFVPRTNGTVPRTAAEVDDIGRVACKLTVRAHARPISAGVPVRTARFSRDGRAVAVFEKHRDSPGGALHVIDVSADRVDARATWGDVPANSLLFGFAPQRDALIITGLDARARVWEFIVPRATAMLIGHKKEVWGLTFSRDGRTLVSSSDDGTLKLWEMASGVERRTLKGHGSLVSAVAYSPDGELLASSGWDNRIRLWKAGSGAEIRTLSGHAEHVCAVAFSPDGKTLASGGDDRAIRLWDVSTGREQTALDRSRQTGEFRRVRNRREDAVFRRRRQDDQALGLGRKRVA